MGRFCKGPPEDMVRLLVGGKSIAMAHMGRIVEKVQIIRLQDEIKLSYELMRLAKAFNYLPSTAEGQYRQAILEYYKEVTGT